MIARAASRLLLLVKTIVGGAIRSAWATPVRRVFLVGCLLFVFCVAYRIHFSSVAAWNSYLQGRVSFSELLSGSPRMIRSDEWMLGLPWLFSQAYTNPPWSIDNPSVGPATSALLVGLPTSHWSALLRPSHWGFYLLDFERGFSWLWMWRSVVPCVALMVLLLELTGGSLACALAGTAWIFFSGFVQWWLASVAELIAYWTIACVSLRYVFIARSRELVLAAATSLLVAAGGFGLSLYPPFQVPLAYLGVALLPFLLRGCLRAQGPSIWFRVALLGISVTLGIGALVAFLGDNTAAIATMKNTSYPGRRISLGGDLSWWRYISGWFESNYTYEVFPALAGNISEASSYILIWPVVLLLIPFFKSRVEIVRFAPLFAFMVLTLLWGFYGVSESVALRTGWSYVPTSRAVIGWGIGGALLCILTVHQPSRLSWTLGSVCSVAGTAFIFWCATQFSVQFPSAISQESFYWAALFISLAVVAIIFRLAWLLAAVMVCVCVVPHSQVNPVMQGLGGIADVPLVKAVRRFDPQHEGRWAVFGSPVLAQLVKVTGRDVVNGSQYTPDLEALRKLDPQQQQLEVYNRYALVAFTLAPEGTPPTFQLLAPDTWELQVDPCDERFKSYGARYIVWANYSSERRFACYERVFVGADFAIYKSKA